VNLTLAILPSTPSNLYWVIIIYVEAWVEFARSIFADFFIVIHPGIDK
jgi:hypothetical protein